MDETIGIWQAVLGEVELTISRGNFITWFKNTHLLEYTPKKAIIGVPNVFIKQQMERRYEDLIADMLAKNGVRPQAISFEIYSSPNMKSNRGTDDTVVINPTMSAAKTTRKAKQSSGVSHNYRQGLNTTLLAAQSREGAWRITEGRERKYGSDYATAMAILTLNVPNQLLPIFQR